MKKGFTLIELLAVIVVIAIIALIGVSSVNKIIKKVRLNASKETAVAARKAVTTYLVSSEDYTNLEIDMSPGSDLAYLVELSKDPWGDPYNYVKAYVSKIENKNIIDLYLGSDNACYFLPDGESELLTDETCGVTQPNITGVEKVSDTTYKIDWQGGIGPFNIYIDNSLISTITNSRTYMYTQSVPKQYTIVIKSLYNKESGPYNLLIPKQLGGPNTVYISQGGPGWALSYDSAKSVVATASNVNDDLLNKSVAEYILTNTGIVGAWGAYARFNFYVKYAPAPIFKTGATYRIKWKARLVDPISNKSFAFSIKDGNSQNRVWNGVSVTLTNTWQSFDYSFVANAEGTGPLFYISLQKDYRLRVSDLEVYNTTPIN